MGQESMGISTWTLERSTMTSLPWANALPNGVCQVKATHLSLQACLLFLLALLLGGPALAQDEKPSLLVQASKAWEVADLNAAADLYDKALKEGGLFPADVIVAYVRIGTVRAAMGQNSAALSAFRVAAALDPSFELPSEAGPKAKSVYKKARKDAQQQGGKLEVVMEAPTQSAPGAEFVVIARVDEAFAPLIVDIGITVQDPSVSTSTIKPWSTKQPADTQVQFEVPGKVVMAGANLLVRVDALDSYGNRWASAQSRVKVEGQSATYGALDDEDFEEEEETKKEEDSDGFWSSPWPWVIGGAILVGGAATYLMTRPSDEVLVSAPAWK